jgi:UDP-N-acetylglucosamine diphosphorylase/glucosamine-1-phosphate N-acetyltransferase
MKIQQIIIVEPEDSSNFYPFSLMHLVCEIRCGALRLFEKLQTTLPNVPLIFTGQQELINSFLLRENFSNNIVSNIPTLMINANVIGDETLISQLNDCINNIENINLNLLFVDENRSIIAAFIVNFQSKDIASISAISEKYLHKKIKLTNIKQIDYLWDALFLQDEQIGMDATLLSQMVSSFNNNDYNGVHFINKSKIKIGKNVSISQGVVLDASAGTILIDDGAKIMYNSVIIGPCYVGKNTIIKIGTKIYQNCSFGQFCKIGGEIENSTFHSFSNKQHNGFIGHSYIGEWVNLGAGTSTSDLNNNYSDITITMPDRKVKTAHQFLGLFIGDHSKTAINTSFNSGSVVGISSMLANTGGLLPKFTNSLKWLVNGNICNYQLDKAIRTAQLVMQRRNKTLSDEEITLIKNVIK